MSFSRLIAQSFIAASIFTFAYAGSTPQSSLIGVWTNDIGSLQIRSAGSNYELHGQDAHSWWDGACESKKDSGVLACVATGHDADTGKLFSLNSTVTVSGDKLTEVWAIKGLDQADKSINGKSEFSRVSLKPAK